MQLALKFFSKPCFADASKLQIMLRAGAGAGGFLGRHRHCRLVPRPQQNIPRESAKSASTRGKQTFTSTCAGCHGLDGRGGERAPNIAENPKVLRFSDAQISLIIENGVPGTGMPAFHSLAQA